MTDTLDAIAREMREMAMKGPTVAWRPNMVDFADRLTALSNHGEGAVAWQEKYVAGEREEQWSFCVNTTPEYRARLEGQFSFRPLYLHPSEADRRDAERYRWLRNKANEARRSDPACVSYPLNYRRMTILHSDQLDAAIDAATQEQT